MIPNTLHAEYKIKWGQWTIPNKMVGLLFFFFLTATDMTHISLKSQLMIKTLKSTMALAQIR